MFSSAAFDPVLTYKKNRFGLTYSKCMLNLLSTNQSQTFSKFLVSFFSIASTSLCSYYMRQESLTYENRFDFTV